MDRLLLKPEEAGVMLGLSRAKVYALIAAGSLPSIRIGGTIRLSVDAIRTWIERQSKKPVAP